MSDNFSRFFLSRYDALPMAERKQIRFLLFILVGIAAGSCLVELALKEAVGIKMAVLVLIALTLCLVFLVKMGRAKAASISASLMLSLVFAAIPFLQHYRGEYELYLVLSTQCFALVVTSLISMDRRQSLPVLAIALLALSGDYFLRVWPAGEPWAHMSDYVTSLAIIALSTFIERGVRARNMTLVSIANEETRKNADRVSKLEGVIASSASALGLGAAVTESTRRTEALIEELVGNLGMVEKAVMGLTESAREITEAHRVITEASVKVHEKVADQASIVEESSAAVEQMTASVGNISDIAAARRDSISQLKATTESGAGEMEKSAEAFAAMKSSAESIAEVMSVIRAVASRTNLLAMNAAIEAAHAGEAGKGFSVVADEIRKLSEETSRNVKLINESIKGTIAAVQSATEVNERTRALFARVETESDAVAGAMEEIGRGLGEISSGSGEILQGVSESVQITATVKESSILMEKSIAAAAEKLEALGSTIRGIQSSLATSVAGFGSMREEISNLSEAGQRNESGLKALADTIGEASA